MSIATVALNTSTYTQIANGAYQADVSLARPSIARVKIVVASSLPAADEDSYQVLSPANTSITLTTGDPATDKIYGMSIKHAEDVSVNYQTTQVGIQDARLPDAGADDEVLVAAGGEWTSGAVPA